MVLAPGFWLPTYCRYFSRCYSANSRMISASHMSISSKGRHRKHLSWSNRRNTKRHTRKTTRQATPVQTNLTRALIAVTGGDEVLHTRSSLKTLKPLQKKNHLTHQFSLILLLSLDRNCNGVLAGLQQPLLGAAWQCKSTVRK